MAIQGLFSCGLIRLNIMLKVLWSFLYGLLLLILFMPVVWGIALECRFDDGTLQQRCHNLAQQLRCPTCPNESLASSFAPVSQDLRRNLRRLLEEGHSDDEIISYMIVRYGHAIRYQPPFSGVSLGLWLMPLLLVGAGFLTLLFWRHKLQIAATNSNDLEFSSNHKHDD